MIFAPFRHKIKTSQLNRLNRRKRELRILHLVEETPCFVSEVEKDKLCQQSRKGFEEINLASASDRERTFRSSLRFVGPMSISSAERFFASCRNRYV